jgi:hypothetical protein
MALVLVATPGAANANSYCTAAEGDAYHDGHLYATSWTSATLATKEAALVMATRLLDVEVLWYAFASLETQALQWPRIGLLDFIERNLIGDEVIPQRLKDITSELARQLIAADRTADDQVETKGLTSLRVGSIALSFKESVSAKPIPDAVRDMIPRHWGYLRRGQMTREVARG